VLAAEDSWTPIRLPTGIGVHESLDEDAPAVVEQVDIVECSMLNVLIPVIVRVAGSRSIAAVSINFPVTHAHIRQSLITYSHFQ
jgi:hypothetical protein